MTDNIRISCGKFSGMFPLLKPLDGSAVNEYLATIFGCLLFFLVGAHTAWPSTAIYRLRSADYPFDVTNEAASYMAISGPIGDIFGEILSSAVVDYMGRKKTILISGLPFLVSCVLIYLCYMSPVLIYIARFLGGLAMGTVTCILPMYVSEISRPGIRGKIGVLTVVFFIFGGVFINLTSTALTIQESALSLALITVVFLFSFGVMPESPYYLLMKGKTDQAGKSLKFFRRDENVDKELASLQEDVSRQLSERGSFRDLLLIESNRRALLVVVSGRLFQQLTGSLALNIYAHDLLLDAATTIQPEMALAIIYTIQAAIAFFSGELSDKFGRVPLMSFSLIASFFTLGAQGVYFTLRDFATFDLPALTPVFLFALNYFLFQIGIGSLLSVLIGEIFSASVKSKAVCLTNIVYSMMVILTTKFYQVSSDYVHFSVPFYFFATCSLVGSFYVHLTFPETKGRTLEEIQMELKGLKRSAEN